MPLARKANAVRATSAPSAPSAHAKAASAAQAPPHRTIDRVTRILEEVVYRPGMTFAELVRALDASKSSVHGFIRGLLAKGWLHEDQRGFHLGPAFYGLALVSGHIRAGLVTHADLLALHQAAGAAVFLGVRAGDHLIYVAEAGADPIAEFEARANIRRSLLATAGGKALLAARAPTECDALLRRRSAAEGELVDRFLDERDAIRRSRIATNISRRGTRFAIATAVCDRADNAVASVTLVGPSAQMQPRVKALGRLLLRHADAWSRRSMTAREAI